MSIKSFGSYLRGRGGQRVGMLLLLLGSWLCAHWFNRNEFHARAGDWLAQLPDQRGNEVSGLLAWLNDQQGPGFHPFDISRRERARKWADAPSWGRSTSGQPPVTPLEVNRADSAALEALPWVGPALAGRICKYRSSLGGFWGMHQLGEVWGMPPEALDVMSRRCWVDATAVVPLCADTASWGSLRKHPYIRSEGARLIERYRKHHPLRRVDDLLGSPAVSDSLLGVWKPYLKMCEPVD